MQSFFLYNNWLRNSASFDKHDKFSVNEATSICDMELINNTVPLGDQQLPMTESSLKTRCQPQPFMPDSSRLSAEPDKEAHREQAAQAAQQTQWNSNKIHANPYLCADFNDPQSVESLYQRATFIQKAAIRDNVLYIHYDPFRKVGEGRTLIITAEAMLIRTKTLPQTLMHDFRMSKRKRHQVLERLNIQKEDKNMPFVCGNTAYVPIASGYRKYQSWLAVHWVDRFININRPSTLVQAECVCPISLKLNVRYGRLYPALYLGFIIWKYQRAAFKTMYHMFLGYNDFPMLNFPHYYMQLLFQEGNDNVFALNEELKNISEEALSELMANGLNEDMSQYFQ